MLWGGSSYEKLLNDQFLLDREQLRFLSVLIIGEYPRNHKIHREKRNDKSNGGSKYE